MDPNSTPSKGKVFPDLPGKSVHHSTDEPELHGIENKGYPMRVPHPGVHAVDTHSVIGQWDQSIPWNCI